VPAAAAKPKPLPTQSTAKRPVLLDRPYAPVHKRPLPPGRPRAWYIAHNRRPEKASDAAIRDMAQLIGVHPPSGATCHMVRALMRS